MNKLHPLHYLPVILRQVEGRVVFFNPIYRQRWLDNISFVKSLKIPDVFSAYLNIDYFNKIDQVHPSDVVTDDIKLFEEFSLECISLPPKPSEQEYFDAIKNNYLVVTEKFISRHVYGHVGASRHALMKDIQLKGVGKTLTTQQMSYPNMNGMVRTADAIRGYYNSLILQASLPYGSVKHHGIICMKGQMHHTAVVVRDALTHRLAQIEPIFLHQRDKEVLKSEVRSFFGEKGPLEILKVIIEQHICLWCIGVEHPSNIDNLSLGGLPMDEEDMRPGHDFSKLTLEFIFKLPEETEIKSQYEEIIDLDFTCYSSFHVRVNNLISWYGESLSWIFDCGEILMTPDEKWQIINNTFLRFYDEEFTKELILLLQSMDSVVHYNRESWKSLDEKVKAMNMTASLHDRHYQFRNTILRLDLKTKMKDHLPGEFNQLRRLPHENVLKVLGQFETGDQTSEGRTSIHNSSSIHSLANRQAFCVSELEVMTPDEFDSYLKDHMNDFALWSITVFGRDGYKEYSAEEYKTQLPLMKEFILVDISVNYQNRSFVIPTYKKWVQLRAS